MEKEGEEDTGICQSHCPCERQVVACFGGIRFGTVQRGEQCSKLTGLPAEGIRLFSTPGLSRGHMGAAGVGAGARTHGVGCSLVSREGFQPWLAGTGRGFRSFQSQMCSDRLASL